VADASQSHSASRVESKAVLQLPTHNQRSKSLPAQVVQGKLSIPKSIRHLRVAELPGPVRLHSMFKSAGVRMLRDLNGRDLGELLEQRHCGLATITALQQLLQHALSGEFGESHVEQRDAPEELVNLIETAIERLPAGDRRLLLQRVGAGGRTPLTLEQLAQQRGVTRERVRNMLDKIFGVLRKTFGPRIPRLLEMVRRRCLSIVCPLTPELLEQWVSGFQSRLRLSAKAHVKIIGALDESIPCWSEGQELWNNPDENARRLAAHVATIVRQAGGHLTVAQTYRQLKTQRRHRSLTVPQFLRLLRNARRIRMKFHKPEQPVIHSVRRLIHRRRSPR